MKNLSKFSPAENEILLKGYAAELKTLMKLTFIALVLKKVLKMIIVEHESKSDGQVKYYNYVVAGKYYSTYQPLAHERIFTSIFQVSSNLKILFRHFVKIGFEKAKNKRSFIYNRVMTNPEFEELFKKTSKIPMFKAISLNEKGKIWKKELEKEMRDLEKKFPDLIAKAPDEAE